MNRELMNEMREYYHEKGFVTLPIIKFNRLENGEKKVSFPPAWTSKTEFDGWDNAEAMAIRTGKVSNLVCIDIDSKEMLDLIKERVGNIKCTYQVKTFKGWHLYYAYDERFKDSVNLRTYGLDIEIKSNGTCVFCAPTDGYSITTPNGTIEEIDGKLAKWLLEIVGDIEKSAKEEVENIKRGKRENWQEVGSGFRNTEMFKSACSEIACGASMDEVIDKALLWNKTLEKPLDEKEIVRSIQSGAKMEERNYPMGREVGKVINVVEEENIFKALQEKGFYCWWDDGIDKFGKRNMQTLEVDFKSKQEFKQSISLELGIDVKNAALLQLPSMRMVFDPQRNDVYRENNVTYINNFRPTEYMLSIGKVDKIPHTIHKVLKNLFQGNAEMLPLFINWLACMLQTRKKSTVGWVFVGDQGSGKGILYDEILRPLFKYTIQVTPNILEDSFNAWMHEKLLINVNEGNQDHKSKTMVHNKLKSWITDPTLQINDKGVKRIERKNTSNFIFTTNDRNALHIEEGDRRFNVIRTGKNLTERDDFIWEEWSDAIRQELIDFAMYLNGFNINLKDYNRCVMTEFKKAMQKSSTTNTDAFCKALKDVDIEFFEEHITEENFKVTDALQQLRNGFISNEAIGVLWEAVVNEKANSMKIGRMLASNEVGKKEMKWINSKAIRGIKLEIIEKNEVF